MVEATRENALARVRRSPTERVSFSDGNSTGYYCDLLPTALESSSLAKNSAAKRATAFGGTGLMLLLGDIESQAKRENLIGTPYSG